MLCPHSSKALSAAIAFCAQLLAPMPASALTTQHATSCVAFDINQNALLTYGVNGVFNTSAAYSFTWLYCPIVRVSEVPPSGSFGVWVDGVAPDPTNSPVTCILSSFSYTGALLGSAAAVMPMGVFDKQIVLPAAQVPLYSSQELECEIHTGQGLYDYEPVW